MSEPMPACLDRHITACDEYEYDGDPQGAREAAIADLMFDGEYTDLAAKILADLGTLQARYRDLVGEPSDCIDLAIWNIQDLIGETPGAKAVKQHDAAAAALFATLEAISPQVAGWARGAANE